MHADGRSPVFAELTALACGGAARTAKKSLTFDVYSHDLIENDA